MEFNQEILNDILDKPCNNFLKKDSKDKYDCLDKIDPFPNIPDALLNATDITKYVLTTGMLEPFEPKRLAGATYTCAFSGTYLRWDENGIQEKKILKEDEELIIEPNSITFLEISTLFRIPQYLVLRFNLQVRNVYKGLLLGTGPIVDPGFVGKLYIPLHNLTSNKYKIKSGADLISVEFTKLSTNPEWKINKNTSLYKKDIAHLDFSLLPYIPEMITSNREVNYYIEKALQKNPDFCKVPDNKIFVNSSMQEIVKKIEQDSKTLKNTEEKVDKKLKEAASRERIITILSIISILSLLISAVTLFITSWTYFSNINKPPQDVEQQEPIEDVPTDNDPGNDDLNQNSLYYFEFN